MHCALKSPVHAVCESLLQALCEQGQDGDGEEEAPRIGFPAAFAWAAEQLHELMCLAANVKDWHTVAALAHCPFAQQVPPDALTVMLQQLLSSLGSDEHARSEDESVAFAANLLQQMGAVLGGELRVVLGVGSAGSIRLASVHKEALLRLAALLPIRHVQPEQLPQPEFLESQPLAWAAVMHITTRMPAAWQWSVESVQQALQRALRNVQPNPAAKTEQNANSLQLMVFSNLMKLPAGQTVSAATVQALLQHAEATGGVFQTHAVRSLLSELPGYAEAVDKLKAAAANSGNGTGSGSGSDGRGPVVVFVRGVGGVFGAVMVGVQCCARFLAWPMRFVLRRGRAEP